MATPISWIRTSLMVSGMLTPRESKWPRMHKAFRIYFVIATAYTFGGSVAYFILMEGAVIEKLQSVQISVTILSGLLKLCNAGLQRAKLEALLDDFGDFWDNLYRDIYNREIMDEAVKRCRQLYKIKYTIVVLVLALNGITPLVIYLLFGAEGLAYQIIIPFDDKKYFVLAQARSHVKQVMQVMQTVCPFLANTSSFVLYLVLSDLLATYMRVVRRMLREQRVTKETVRAHQGVIRLVRNTNEMFSWLLYFETCTISIECSSSAYVFYKINIKQGTRENILGGLTNFVFCFFIPYIICYCGNKVTTESELLFRDAYYGSWYERDMQAKKNLRMVMLGASKTLNLRYKNLSIFGMELFLAILNMTYKFLNAILWLE